LGLAAVVGAIGCLTATVSGSADLGEAWAAWRAGDVADAERLAAAHAESDEGRHLLFLCDFVQGDYVRALARHAEIDPAYPRHAELDPPVVEAYLHLARYADARAFAQRNGRLSEPARLQVSLRAGKPLTASLEGHTVVTFADHPLAPFFPAFEAEIEGHEHVVHLDTGGTFLIMGPDRAAAFGIELTPAGEGSHGSRRVPMSLGVAKRLRLGGAVLENVPVATLASLTGSQDFVIFGTNVLEQFLSTLDYPNARLILSKRGDPEAERAHRELLDEGDAVEIPFYMWGDHYMFARGGVGVRRDLNWFIDSGLVSLHPDGQGGMRQAAFIAAGADYLEWGVDPGLVKDVFELPLPLSLGPLEQTGLLVLARDEGSPARDLGGIRIDGLLSHAFLKRYAWTLDFDRRVYRFHQEAD
ncbi:MAG: retropepsin-like aspartic protease, partial [Myxococcota bacterium]